MCTENWKPVIGFEGYYEISDLGHVRSLDRTVETSNNRTVHISGKQLKPDIKPEGYLAITLYRDGVGKKMYVHRMVAEAFVPNPNGYDFVDHINCVRDDPRSTNLRWVTAKENVQHSIEVGNYDVDQHRMILNDDENRRKANDVNRCPVIRDDGVIYQSVSDASKAMGYKSTSVLSRHLNGRAWSVRGHTFKYLKKPKRASNAKQVCQVDIETGEILAVYRNTSEAVSSIGSTGILHCLAGDAKTSCGYIWKYLDSNYPV